jgi:outer membrane receptor protein involved in Fe transport
MHTSRSTLVRLVQRRAGAAPIIAALISAPFTAQLWAQDATGRIAGNVTDPSGAAVAGAKVVVTDLGTQTARETKTDKSGHYQVPQLPIGSHYEISAEASGFRRTINRPEAVLDINQTLRVDLVLSLGSMSQSVTVESVASTVETTNAVVGGVVSGQAIFELPLNGRNTLDLLATQPGVTASNPDNGGAGAYSIGGQRTDSVTYLLDGGNNNNLLSNGIVVNPNPDAIAEFRVLESDYGAEYGRNAGGIVSVVTKSGTNQLHGTLYDYLRNEDLDANLFFNNEQGQARPILKRNQFGGTVGGPIIIPKVLNGKDKLFFFFAYEGQRQSQLSQAGKVNTFTPAEAAGNFSQAVNGGPDPNVVTFLQNNPYYQSNPALAAQAIIDPAAIDPVAAKYFQLGLIPTSPTGYLFPEASATNNYNEYLGRMDYYVTNRDIVSGTFTSQANPLINPFPFANVAGYSDSTNVTTYFGSVTYTHTFTPSLLNEFRITAQRHNNLQDEPLGPNASATPAVLGIGVTPDQATGPTLLGFYGSNLSIGYSYQGPTALIDNTYAFYDNLSWTRGRHSMKFGFYFSPYQNNTTYDFIVDGIFSFYGPGTSVGSGTDFADFLMGNPDEYTQYGRAPSNIRSHQYAAYGQDEWHVTKNLTLTLGLRYEYAEPKFDTQGRTFSLIPGDQSQRFPNAPTDLVFPGDPGAPKGSNFPDKNDFAPRFGFAWDVFGDSKTSLRGGFGVFYDILKGEDNLQFNGQIPFASFADIYFSPPNPNSGQPESPLSQTFPAAGAINPFPSRPPASDVNFADSGFLPFGGSAVFFVDPHLRTPYVYQYNMSLQHQFASTVVAELSYVGYAAHKLTGLIDQNPFILGTNTRLLNTTVTNFSYLDTFENIGDANYNALQASLTKRFGGTPSSYFSNSFLQVSYTLGHELDNVSGFRQRNSLVPYYEHDAFYASGDADVRNALSVSGGWELPFEKMWEGGPKLLTKGWSLYPIMQWHTGFPLDVFAGLDTTPSDPGPSGAGDAGVVHADLVGSSVGILNPQNYQSINGSSGNYWFNPGNFSNSRLLMLDGIASTNAAGLNGQYTYGTLGRNAFRGPGYVDFDLAVAKHFYIGEKFDTEFRADMFNVLNHANFSNPDLTITDSTFGQISTTLPQRIIQLALHLRF